MFLAVRMGHSEEIRTLGDASKLTHYTDMSKIHTTRGAQVAVDPPDTCID